MTEKTTAKPYRLLVGGKWIEDRSENLQADSFGRDYHISAEVAARKDGTLTAVRIKTIADLKGKTISVTRGAIEDIELSAVAPKEATIKRFEDNNSTIAAYRGVQRALRTKEWKLVLYNVNGTRTTQLFDLKNDPWQTKNVAADPRYARARARHAAPRLLSTRPQRRDPADRRPLDGGHPGGRLPRHRADRHLPRDEYG